MYIIIGLKPSDNINIEARRKTNTIKYLPIVFNSKGR